MKGFSQLLIINSRLNKVSSIRLCIIIFSLLLCPADLIFGAILFQDDFSYFDSPNNHGWGVGPTSSIAIGAGPDGSNALKITFNYESGADRWNNWNAPANLQELYIKFNFKLDCGAGTCAGGAKFLKLFGIRNGNNYANTTFPLTYQTANLDQIIFGCMSDTRDAGSAIRYSGNTQYAFESGCPHPNITQYSASINPKDGNWHTFEVHAKYNDDHQDNGAYEVWYDNRTVVSATGVNNRSDNNSKYFKYVLLGGWNQAYGGIPYDIYFDNVIITTTRPPKLVSGDGY